MEKMRRRELMENDNSEHATRHLEGGNSKIREEESPLEMLTHSR